MINKLMLGLQYLSPPSTIFQLYHGVSNCFFVEKTEEPRESHQFHK
jgi:hypothetical protein